VSTARPCARGCAVRSAPTPWPPVGGMGRAEMEELKRLRKQVKELELEKEILRRAAQYLAKE
jgi:transposase